MSVLTRPVGRQEREAIMAQWQPELRRRLRLRARLERLSAQCEGSTYIGGRCANSAAPGSNYCYAHKEGT